MILSRAFRIITVGLAFGLIGVGVSTLVAGSLLFGVGRLDPVALLGGAILLAGVGTIGALVPCVRGTRLSPVSALRTE